MQCALRWISKPSSNTKSLRDKSALNKKSKSTVVENKQVNRSQTKQLEVSNPKNDLNSELQNTGFQMASASESKMLSSSKDTNRNCSGLGDKIDCINETFKSWSELVEEETGKVSILFNRSM